MAEGKLLIDGTCPGEHWRENYEAWRSGGASCCVVTVASTEDCRTAVGLVAEMLRFVRERADDLVLARDTETILRAGDEGRLAVVFHLQGTQPLEYDADLVEVYHQLGVRMIQLAYNRRGPVCDGCEEPGDAGISRFGRQIVAELNRLGIVVDVSHTGARASLEAVELSTTPVVASHSNCRAIRESSRNISDELIRAIAASGGVVGACGFPALVSDSPQATLDEFVDHIVHVAEIAGPEHAALGLDYVSPEPAPGVYGRLIASGEWSAQTYPPPPWRYPREIDDASGLPNLVRRLGERGFSAAEVDGIVGGNWLRVFESVWH